MIKIDSKYAAIDPMALVLSTKAYLIWVEIHHPNVPRLSNVAEVINTMNIKERNLPLLEQKH